MNAESVTYQRRTGAAVQLCGGKYLERSALFRAKGVTCWRQVRQ
jgi:hypothetical protein